MTPFFRFLNAIEYRISGGTEYLWESYPNAHMIDCYGKFADASLVFNRENRAPYEVQVRSHDNRNWYRWIDSEFKPRHDAEAIMRGIDPAVPEDDGRRWSDIDSYDDIIEQVGVLMWRRGSTPRAVEAEASLSREDESPLF